MNSTASAVSSTVPLFYLFKSPLAVCPPFELWRRLSNKLAKNAYRHFSEPGFTEEGLLYGIRKGILSCAEAIRLPDYQQLDYLMTTPACVYVKRRLEDIPPEIIKDRLTFSEENIVYLFNHSSFYSADKFMGFTNSARPTFYTTSVAFIDKKSNKPISHLEAHKRLNDLLVCNITFARIHGENSKWKISDVNFFDGNVVRNY